MNVSYIVWDGFACQANGGVKMATVYFFGTTGCVLRNTTINGGTTIIQSTDNRECLRVDDSTDFTASNCKIWNCRQVDGGHNTSAIKMYDNSGGVLEQLEIYNCEVGIYVKSRLNDYIIRNSFIHDSSRGIYVTPSMAVMQSDRGKVYNNLIVNTTVAAFESDNDQSTYHGDNWHVYNNTFYNCGLTPLKVSGNTPGHGWTIYNNIAAIGSDQLFVTTAHATLAAADHNQWGPAGLKWVVRRYQTNQAVYRTLGDWQASTELENGGHPGVGDFTSDPRFANGSGTLSRKSDFVSGPSSPCKGAGRNGVDMGALDIVTAVGYIETSRTQPVAPRGVALKLP